MSSVLAAVVAAILVVGFFALRGRRGSTGVGKAPGWLSFVAGALGVLAIGSPMVESALAPDGVDSIGKNAPWIFQASMVLGLVALAVGIYTLVRRECSWRSWVGTVAGGLVTAFWLLFGVGELVSPH